MDIEQAKQIISKKVNVYHVSEKVERYIGQFYDGEIKHNRILAKVVGNHGEYTVSIKIEGNYIDYNCSCYIGKDGCHHSVALAHTFLKSPESFKIVKEVKRSNFRSVEKLRDYLDYVTLDELTEELKTHGLTQQDFARATGTSSAHLSAIKRSEARNRYFKELGAIKLACLWMIDNAKKLKKVEKTKKKNK